MQKGALNILLPLFFFSFLLQRHRQWQMKKVNERGETPLHVAAIYGNVERAEALLKQVLSHLRNWNHSFFGFYLILIQIDDL